MKARWKKLISLFGVAAMLTTQNGLMALAANGETEDNIIGSEEDEENVKELSDKIEDEQKQGEIITEDNVELDNEEVAQVEDEYDSSVLNEEAGIMAIDDEGDGSGTEGGEGNTNGDDNNSNVSTDAIFNLQWGDKDEYPGKAMFNTTLSNDTRLTLELLKYNTENEKLEIVTTRGSYGADGEVIALNWDINEDGDYTFTVRETGSDKVYTLDPDDTSNYYFHYTKPQDSVVGKVNPEDCTIDDGTLTWQAVDNVEYYTLSLYEVDGNKWKKVLGSGTDKTQFEFSNLNPDLGYYAIIRSCSKNINTWANGDFSDKIWIRKVNKLSSDSNTNTDDNNNASSGTEEESSSSASTSEATTPQPAIGNSIGWGSLTNVVDKAITDAVANATTTAIATTTAVVNINLNGVDTVPATAINAIAGKDVVLSLSVDTNTLVTIDGSQLTAADVSDVKLVSGKSTEGNTTLNVRAGNSNIEKSIVVYSNIGVDKVGSEVVLYFVNEDQSLVEFRTSPVYENGYAAFTTPLVSANYKIAIK
jgi:hypothetical protein